MASDRLLLKKFIPLITVLILFQHFCYSQKKGQELTDSLFSVLKTEKGNLAEVSALNVLAFEFRNNNPDTAIYFSNKAVAVATKLNDKMGAADAYLNIGSAAFNLGNYEMALNNISAALKIYDELLHSDKSADSSKILKQKARGCTINGNISFNKGNYPEALKNYYVSLKIREKIGDKKGVASVYNNIASVYIEEGNYPQALKIHFAALKIREELDDKDGIATSYNNIGNAYNGMRNYTEALSMHFAALKIRQEIGYKKGIADSYNNIGGIYNAQGKYPEALTNHLAALKIREEIGDQQGLTTSYNNIGSVFQEQNNNTEALKNYFAALKIAEEIGDKGHLSLVCVSIGTVYVSEKKNIEAARYLNKGLLYAKEVNGLDYFRNAYAGLAALDSAQGNFKQSLVHYKMYVAYRDSLFNEENTKKAVQSEMQYEFDKKESVAKAEQDKKDALTNAEITREKIVRNFSLAGILGVLTLSGYVIYNFRKRKKLENMQELANERLRISRELHDDIGSTLGSIAVYSDVAKNRSLKNDNPLEILSKIGVASRELIEKMSDIVWSLNPENETFEQLQNRMQAFAAMILTARNISFDFKSDAQLNALVLTSEQRKNIFLIYKEAIHNIVKYAESKNVLISISKSNNQLYLSIKDDGIGFDITPFEEGRGEAYNGNGLKNMKARAAEMNASLNITSQKNEGTVIELKINI